MGTAMPSITIMSTVINAIGRQPTVVWKNKGVAQRRWELTVQ